MKMELEVRRSTVEDIPSIRQVLINNDPFMYVKRFATKFTATKVNLSSIIETHYLSITALDATTKAIVGFAAFSDSPHLIEQFPRGVWDSWLSKSLHSSYTRNIIAPCNSLWLTFLACGEQAEGEDALEISKKIFSTALATCPQVQHVLYCLQSDTPLFAPLSILFEALPMTYEKQVSEKLGVNFDGAMFCLYRDVVIQPLFLRAGIVEDYDDFVPLLLSGVGVVTPLPDNLYLEELLQESDPFRPSQKIFASESIGPRLKNV